MIIFTGEIKLDSPIDVDEIEQFKCFASLRFCTLFDDHQTMTYQPETLNYWKNPLKELMAYVAYLGKKVNGTIYIKSDDEIVGDIGSITIKDSLITSDITDSYQIINDLLTKNKQLIQENEQLKQKCQQLKIEIDYMPGGEGAQKAKEHWESLL